LLQVSYEDFTKYFNDNCVILRDNEDKLNYLGYIKCRSGNTIYFSKEINFVNAIKLKHTFFDNNKIYLSFYIPRRMRCGIKHLTKNMDSNFNQYDIINFDNVKKIYKSFINHNIVKQYYNKQEDLDLSISSDLDYDLYDEYYET